MHRPKHPYRFQKWMLLCALIWIQLLAGSPSDETLSPVEILSRIEEIETALEDLPETQISSPAWTLGLSSRPRFRANPRATATVFFDEPHPIDLVALMPAIFTDQRNQVRPYGFPKHFTILRILENGKTSVIADYRDEPYDIGGIEPKLFPCEPIPAMGIIVIVRQYATDETLLIQPDVFAFSELFAFVGPKNVALGKRVHSKKARTYEYIWTPEALTDGFSHFSPVDNRTRSILEESYNGHDSNDKLTFDLGTERMVDEFRLWPVSTLNQMHFSHATGLRFPRKVRIEKIDRINQRAPGTLLYQNETPFPRPGATPLMIPVKPTKGRYFRLYLDDPYFDFRNPTKGAITLSEIQILEAGVCVSEGIEPLSGRTSANRIVLTDSRTSLGDILPLRYWIEKISERAKLEKELEVRKIQYTAAIQAQKEQLRLWNFASIFIIIILGLFITLAYMLNNRRLARMHNRIACDLHDEIGANLSSIANSNELIERSIASPSAIQKELIQSASETARDTAHSVRGIVEILEDKGESATPSHQMHKIAKLLLPHIEHSMTLNEIQLLNKLSPSNKWDFLMFFKEALNNIVKHAQASNVSISTEASKRTFTLQIKDNGIGLKSKDIQLDHLKIRAEKLGGLLNVESGPSEGTSIRLTFKIGILG